MLLKSSLLEARDAAKHPIMHRTARTARYKKGLSGLEYQSCQQTCSKEKENLVICSYWRKAMPLAISSIKKKTHIIGSLFGFLKF